MKARTQIRVAHGSQHVVALLRQVLDERDFCVTVGHGHDTSPTGVAAGSTCLIADLDGDGRQWRKLLREAKHFDNTAVVLVTSRPVVQDIVEALDLGAADVVDLRRGASRLRAAVMCAVGRESDLEEQPIELVRLDLLTPREREVLHLVAAGLPSKAIAAKLHISKRTVDMHRHRMLRRVKARSSIELVRALLVAERASTEAPS